MNNTIIVMGVSGSGKSTIGIKLAQALDVKFIDGDDLHPRRNIIKMASGQPLNDIDREPWLTRINDAVYSLASKNEHGVIVCSSLKKQYRDHIRKGNSSVTFLFLDGDKALIQERIQQRGGHFMKQEMLNSQFDSLERPDNEPDTTIISIDHPIEMIVEQAISQLTNCNEVSK